ncbi:MAG: methylated-DNA--[protein]-cysteine S-methyltransferase [Betaproteobacteria bacterium]|nr:methylated-DNA--[protein]-cysteine S-methyltransferase [Betaproteobacteria bacterium]
MKPHDRSIYQAIVAAPTFALGVACDEMWITGIDFLPAGSEKRPENPLASEAVRQLRAYLSDPRFVFGLPLKPQGTAFQRRVWEQIVMIESGQTRTYGELARALNNAPRAVGQACGANPHVLAVPCHRVVAANKNFNDGLGGFNRENGGAALEIKRWLLAHEL